MSVTVANEPTASGGLENGGFKDPEILLGAAQGENGLGVDAGTVVLLGHPKKLGVGDATLRLGLLSLSFN